MHILLIDNENICTDTNFIDLKKNIVSFLDIGKNLLLGNVLILCIFFCKIPGKSLAHLQNSKIKTDYFSKFGRFYCLNAIASPYFVANMGDSPPQRFLTKKGCVSKKNGRGKKPLNYSYKLVLLHLCSFYHILNHFT